MSWDGGNGNGTVLATTRDGGDVPQDLDVERGLLASMILDPECIDDVIRIVKPEDFFRDSHEILAKTIIDMRAGGLPIDGMLLVDRLKRDGMLEKVGGDEGVMDIQGTAFSSVNASYYAAIVYRASIARDMMQVGWEIANEGRSNSLDADQMVAKAEARLIDVLDRRQMTDVVEVGPALKADIERIKARKDHVYGGGVIVGYPDLDEMICGFNPGTLTIIAARPSLGKSALAVNFAVGAATNPGNPVYIASLEMQAVEIRERMLSCEARIDNRKLKSGHLSRIEDEAIENARLHLEGISPMFIDDSPSMNVAQIAASARRMKRRTGLAMVVIDYIQLIDSGQTRDSRQEQVAKISRRLKTLARELDVPVFALSQLNRESEKREDRRPRLAELRESGAIEQDADFVLLLHRPDHFDPNDSPGVAEVIIAKNRNGATGSVHLGFVKHCTRFQSLDTRPPIQADIF